MPATKSSATFEAFVSDEAHPIRVPGPQDFADGVVSGLDDVGSASSRSHGEAAPLSISCLIDPKVGEAH